MPQGTVTTADVSLLHPYVYASLSGRLLPTLSSLFVLMAFRRRRYAMVCVLKCIRRSIFHLGRDVLRSATADKNQAEEMQHLTTLDFHIKASLQHLRLHLTVCQEKPVGFYFHE
ncbi:hypothetical protein JOB18_044287 [Solea senegalensis]|uniref:Uncharacterized protein n=1 Tax=Solea senegalensis TaxID=28829 RepID=A0AAV6SXF0_SOLSE|nr:hypothetical protein JOB18_044287 [Solea senegalensis]